MSFLTLEQNKQFLYEYQFIPDSINNADITSEIMILNVLKDRCEYYSAVRYAMDSAQAADYKKGIYSMPQVLNRSTNGLLNIRTPVN